MTVGDKRGFIDPTGKLVINPQFDYADDFENGLALVGVGNKFGYIDTTGRYVINPQYQEASRFAEGFARVAIGDNDTGIKYGYIK